MADAAGLNLTPDGFVLPPKARAWRDAKLAALIPAGAMLVATGAAIFSGSVLAIVMCVGLGGLFTFVTWYTSTPPIFAKSGDLITLRGHVQKGKLSKNDLAGIYRGKSSGRGSSRKTYSFLSKRGPGTFDVDVRFFDADELERAVSSIGVEVAGDFTAAQPPLSLFMKWMGIGEPGSMSGART